MQFSSLQVSWLIAFVESAEHKRTSAAATLGVTQSAVTKYIRKLESWCGGGLVRPLMEENMHPPVLTAEGKDFLPKAKQLLALLREAQPKPLPVVQASPKVPAGEIRVPPPAPRTLDQ